MKPSHFTLAFSSHRPESLPFMEDSLPGHDTVVLEEPPRREFQAMLRGRMSIEDYLLESDTEYPEFARRSCLLARRLAAEGRAVLQVEPFLQVLTGIHERFAQGGDAGEFEPGSDRFRVYRAERLATAALLHYYERVMKGSFEEVVEAVKTFARADASRGRLRDAMRAEALAKLDPAWGRVYVETGYIHYALWGELFRRVKPSRTVKPLFLMDAVARQATGKRQVWGPGDILTLLYVFHPGFRGKRADLLAARSLVHVKLLEKEEMSGENGSCPHLRDEAETLAQVSRLSYENCKELFPRIRLASTPEARSAVAGYPDRKG